LAHTAPQLNDSIAGERSVENSQMSRKNATFFMVVLPEVDKAPIQVGRLQAST
jgi:hypothetical protein